MQSVNQQNVMSNLSGSQQPATACPHAVLFTASCCCTSFLQAPLARSC
jgi:hypothetical protein